jgi:hypothetical protein
MLKIGLPIVLTLATGGALAPITTSLIISLIPDIMETVASGDYSKMNARYDLTTRNLESGLYKALVLNLGSSNALTVDVSCDYTVTEIVTRYRMETQYRDETKIIDTTKRVTLFEYFTQPTS